MSVTGCVLSIVQGGWTGLVLAAQNGHLEVVRLLVDKGADINAMTEVHMRAQRQIRAQRSKLDRAFAYPFTLSTRVPVLVRPTFLREATFFNFQTFRRIFHLRNFSGRLSYTNVENHQRRPELKLQLC